MAKDLELRASLSGSVSVRLLHLMKQEISLEELAASNASLDWAIGSHGKVLGKEGTCQICGSEGPLQPGRPVSGRGIGDRETRERLSHVCLRGCENVGTGGGRHGSHILLGRQAGGRDWVPVRQTGFQSIYLPSLSLRVPSVKRGNNSTFLPEPA